DERRSQSGGRAAIRRRAGFARRNSACAHAARPTRSCAPPPGRERRRESSNVQAFEGGDRNRVSAKTRTPCGKWRPDPQCGKWRPDPQCGKWRPDPIKLRAPEDPMERSRIGQAGVALALSVSLSAPGMAAQVKKPDLTVSKTALEKELLAKYGEGQRVRLARGLKQVAQFWRAEDGDSKAF